MSKTEWRLLNLDVDSYAEATMSLSPAIAQACEEGKVPETLAMYTHRHPSIVMGRQNDPDVDVNFDYCRSHGIKVKRIPTPGTIFGHTGYIMNVLYIHRDRVPGAIPDIFATLNRQCASAFTREWGIEARHRPINDLEVKTGETWKKVGPFGLAFFGPFLCCRMGLTITPIPYDTVEMAMPGPPEKFADKKEKSVSARVGSLEEALGRELEIHEAKEVVKNAFAELFQIDFVEGSLSETEKKYESRFLELYDSDAWFWANSVSRRFPKIPEGASIHEHIHKIANGPLVRARVLKTATDFLDCSLTGWYHGIRPQDAIERVESYLKDISLDENEILSRIEKAFSEEDLEIDQCSPADLQSVILQAISS